MIPLWALLVSTIVPVLAIAASIAIWALRRKRRIVSQLRPPKITIDIESVSSSLDLCELRRPPLAYSPARPDRSSSLWTINDAIPTAPESPLKHISTLTTMNMHLVNRRDTMASISVYSEDSSEYDAVINQYDGLTTISEESDWI